MMSASRTSLALLLMLVTMQLPSVASACSCIAFPEDPDEAAKFAYSLADVIFLGVAEGQKTKRGYPARSKTLFRVEAEWKGPGLEEIIVESNIGEIACGYEFKKNQRYLVFSYWDESDDFVTTSFCDLTGTEAESGDLIAALDRINPR